ncbi:MAG: hypothetical protein IBJ10_10685 [Phycisphaerales bacterium]|nr:hypothetical protein [Phycisphaerales bacterium]
MATSRETFTQVKDILRKLDRSIDAARERRTGPDHRPGMAAPARPQPPQSNGRADHGPTP